VKSGEKHSEAAEWT